MSTLKPLLKLAVVGGREFADNFLLAIALQEYANEYDLIIISGGARGADSLAYEYAKANGLPFILKAADWDKHGKSAGYIRNADIVAECDEVIAFWDGKSKGTQHTINLARKKGKTVVVINYTEYTQCRN